MGLGYFFFMYFGDGLFVFYIQTYYYRLDDYLH